MVEVDVARYVQGLFTLDAIIMMTCCVTLFLNEWGGKGGEYEWSSVLQTSILVRHPPLQPAYGSSAHCGAFCWSMRVRRLTIPLYTYNLNLNN